MADTPLRKAFCTAPWTELHLLHDGRTRPCDHSSRHFGNWQEEGIEGVWKGKEYREFRRKILSGEAPDDQCQSCAYSHTASNLRSHIGLYFQKSVAILERHLKEELHPLFSLRALGEYFDHPHPGWEPILRSALAVIASLKEKTSDAEAASHLNRLELLAQTAEDFLRGREVPRSIAPFRKVRIRNKCNARCIMCAGKFNGDIVSGPSMEDQFVLHTADHCGHLVNYSSEISEFFLIPQWKEIAARLGEDGLPRLKVFTNGMLLSPENLRFLLDCKALDLLHVSMNGASREVLEAVQVNVRYDALLKNIRGAVEVLREIPNHVNFAFSFILMKRNLHEMPRFVELIHELTLPLRPARPMVYFAYLESNNEMPAYRRFLFEEHPALAGEEEVLQLYREAHALGEQLGVDVILAEESLRAFLDSRRALPKLACKPADLPLVKELVGEGKGKVLQLALAPVSVRVKRALDAIFSAAPDSLGELSLEPFLGEEELVLAREPKLPLLGFSELEESADGKWRWALGESQEIGLAPQPGKNKVRYRLHVPRGGTVISLRLNGGELGRLEATGDRELLQGELEFDWAESELTGTLQVRVVRPAGGERAFPGDQRPLAYAVHAFALL